MENKNKKILRLIIENNRLKNENFKLKAELENNKVLKDFIKLISQNTLNQEIVDNHINDLIMKVK